MSLGEAKFILLIYFKWNMYEFYTIIRWIHTLSASIWFGQLFILNVILFPVFFEFKNDDGKNIFEVLYPKLIQNGLHISITTVMTGLFLYENYARQGFSMFIESNKGISLTIASVIALVLMVYNITINRKVKKQTLQYDLNNISKKGPAWSLILMTFVFVLMMYSSHGF